MPLNIRTTYSRITANAENKYQRALQYIGITDCTEMRVSAAVAVCVLAWYTICAIAWVADLLHNATTLTALITNNR